MNITHDSTVIIVNDFEKMKDFYSKTLNQEIKLDFGNCIVLSNGIAIWQLRNEYPIAKKLGYKYCEEGNNNLEICFTTEEIETVKKELEDQDVKFMHKIEEETWGQQTIRFYDPENNLIEIGESIPCFVNRLHRSGMSFNEVSEKTGVDVETVKTMLD